MDLRNINVPPHPPAITPTAASTTANPTTPAIESLTPSERLQRSNEERVRHLERELREEKREKQEKREKLDLLKKSFVKLPTSGST